MIAYAQTSVENARAFVERLNEVIIFPLITLLAAIALLLFLWGGLQFVLGAGNPEARKTGQRHMIWGIIGLLVMVSAYAILSVAVNTLPGAELDRYSTQGVFR
jgi:multidrug transporter EmrE-like cation transporter